MKDEQQLKLQAWLDGELSDSEARAVADWVAKDAEAKALAAELKNTCGALSGFEAEVKLPETREFYWSKISREIERAERVDEPAPARAASLFLAFRKLLVPATAVAAVLLAIALIRPGGAVSDSDLETAMTDANAFTYRDYDHGTTLVWLPYPAENEFTDAEPASIVD
jgi:anti-sigma factor RsiW